MVQFRLNLLEIKCDKSPTKLRAPKFSMRKGRGWAWFFPLYTEIRFRVKIPHWVKLFCTLFCYLQSIVVITRFANPLDLRVWRDTLAPWDYVRAFFFCLTWIFTTTNLLHESMFYFCLLLVVLIAVCVLNSIMAKRRFIPYIFLAFVVYFQQIFCHVMCVPLAFRLACVTEILMVNFNHSALLSFCVLIVTIFLLFIHLYLSSIFLEAFFFCYDSTLDVYEGKFGWFLVSTRIIMAYCAMMYDVVPKNLGEIAFPCVMFLLFVILFCLRAVRRVHLTVGAQYIELGPSFLLPVMTVCEGFYTSRESTWWVVTVAVLSQVALVVILYLLDFFTSKQVTRIFGGFLRRDSVQEFAEYPSFVFGTMVSVLRIISVKRAEPDFFIRFMNMLTDKKKSSQFIEVARFLGLFPSKRRMILTTLKGLNPKWIHNRFMVHMLKKILRSSINNAKEKHIEPLVKLQQQHIIHSHLFWKARQEKRKMAAFVESLSVVHYYKELVHSIRSARDRFPFDPAIVKIESDFYLSACGNFNKGLEARKLAEALEVSRNAIVDPILHPMSINNPRILMYCDEEERSASMVRKEPEKRQIEPQGIRRPISFAARTPPPQQKQESVASILSVSRRAIPLCQYGDFVIAIMILSAYFFTVQPCQSVIMDVVWNSTNYTTDIGNSLVKVTGSLVGSYVLELMNDTNLTGATTKECFAHLIEMVAPLLAFVQEPSATQYAETVLLGNIRYFRDSFRSGLDICTIAENVPNGMREEAEENLAVFDYKARFMHSQMLALDRELSHQFFIVHFAVTAVVVFVVYNFCVLLTIGIQVNSIMKNEDRVIDYMSSNQRKNLLLDNKVEQAWNLLRRYKQKADNSETTESNKPTEEEDTQDRRMSEMLNLDDRAAGHRHWFTTLSLVLPLFYELCMFLVVYQAMIQRTHEIQTTTNTLIGNYKFLNVSAGLIRSTMDVIDNVSESVLPFTQAEEILSTAGPRVSVLYSQNHNFSVGTEHYYVSAQNVTLMLGSDHNASDEYLIRVALPCIIRFNVALLEQVFNPDFLLITQTPSSSGYSFFALVILLGFLFLPLAIAHFKVTTKGFNSLFHFPKEYLSSHKVVDTPTATSTGFPEMVLAVTYVIESDQIYSISNNCQEILRKPSNELIGAEMSATLPLDDTVDGKFRTAKGKRFRFVDQKFDKLTKLLMVEDQTPSGQVDLGELRSFMPRYFASMFCQDQIGKGKAFPLRNSLLIQFRIAATSTTDPLRDIDGKTNAFYSLEIIRVEGSTVTLCTVHDCNVTTAFYVIRDIYDVLLPKDMPLYSAMIEWIDEAELDVSIDGEPYLDMYPDLITPCEQQLYYLPRGMIGISRQVVSRFPQLQGIVLQFNDNVFTVPFQVFAEHFRTF